MKRALGVTLGVTIGAAAFVVVATWHIVANTGNDIVDDSELWSR